MFVLFPEINLGFFRNVFLTPEINCFFYIGSASQTVVQHYTDIVACLWSSPNTAVLSQMAAPACLLLCTAEK